MWSSLYPSFRQSLACHEGVGGWHQDGLPVFYHMPSRQERRRLERDAAKRAPAKAGAAGAAGAGGSGGSGGGGAGGGGGGAAATLVDVHVNPLGDWSMQAENPWDLIRAIGVEGVRQRAAEGDMEAQFSMGIRTLREADGFAQTAVPGASGRSYLADVGLVSLHHTVSSRSGDRDASWVVTFS